MNLAADMGRYSGRATPSLHDAPYRQFEETTGRRSTYLLPIAVQTNPATSNGCSVKPPAPLRLWGALGLALKHGHGFEQATPALASAARYVAQPAAGNPTYMSTTSGLPQARSGN
jgi:hypothetical protein